jgi:Clostripain family
MFDPLTHRYSALTADADTSLASQTRTTPTGFRTRGQDALLLSDAASGRASSSRSSQPDKILSLLSPEAPPLDLPVAAAPALWTVMVYMAADTLETFAVEDFLEMAAIGSNAGVNIVVQLDRTAGSDTDTSYGDWTDTRRGLVRAGDTPTELWGSSLGEVDMGDVSSLADFVNWSMGNYQAENYALVTWGHGSGFGVAYDDRSYDVNGSSNISAQELNAVLSTAVDRVDLVGADACLMGMTEFAYEICNSASVFVGSQELEPGTGWDYTSILADLSQTPTLTAAQWGGSIVQHYGEFYSGIGNDPWIAETLSAIDLSALQDSNANGLGNRLNQFAAIALTTATADDLFRLDQTRDALANRFGDDSYPDYCDVGQLFTTIANDAGFSVDVRTAAQAVVDAYSAAIIRNFSADGRGTGLSLYFSDKGRYARSDYTTQAASFTANTVWDEFLNSPRW